MPLHFLVALLVLSTSAAAAAAAAPPAEEPRLPACLTSAGVAVDWWLALKHPGGDDFSYTDARSGSGWAPARPGLGATSGSPLAATLGPLFAPPAQAGLAWAAWNDEPPLPPPGNGTAAAAVSPSSPPWFAHAKGVLAVDTSPAPARGGGGGGGGGGGTGLWLLHSAPAFPALAPGVPYAGLAPPQRTFGQTFLCVSLDRRGAAAAVAALAAGFRPRAYASAGGSPGGAADAAFPGFAALAGTGPPPQPVPAGLHRTDLATAGGVPLALFTSAGGAHTPAALWDEGVARGLSPAPAALAVASWRRGPGRALPPACNGVGGRPPSPAVLNVLAVRPPGAGRPAWSGEDDHGKWGAVLLGGEGGGGNASAASCVGDANREASQAVRGGAAVCLGGVGVLAGAVAAVDACVMRGLGKGAAVA